MDIFKKMLKFINRGIYIWPSIKGKNNKRIDKKIAKAKLKNWNINKEVKI